MIKYGADSGYNVALEYLILSGSLSTNYLKNNHNICVSAAFQTLIFLIEQLIWQAGQHNSKSGQLRKL